MGIIRNAANQQIRGKVGSFTYYVSEGRQIARQALNNSNYGKSASRSEAQQNQRIKWANLVNFYKVCQNWMPKAFEAKKKGQSDYNRLMQVNMPFTDIYLTKTLATIGACIAEDYIISQGSLPSVEVTPRGQRFETNIYLGGLNIDGETTVGEFTTALIGANVNIEAGMQISFVSLQQSVDNMGTPRLICTFYEVTLNATSEEILYDYLPELCCQSSNDCLATANGVSLGAFAYVVSDLRGGALQVSTQQLITNNEVLIERYSGEQARLEAIASYGVDEDVVLSPLTENESQATPAPQYISSFMAGSRVFADGSAIPNRGALDGPYVLTFATNIAAADIDYITIYGSSRRAFVGNFVQFAVNSISLTDFDNLDLDEYCERIDVTMKNGARYLISFTHASQGE